MNRNVVAVQIRVRKVLRKIGLPDSFTPSVHRPGRPALRGTTKATQLKDLVVH